MKKFPAPKMSAYVAATSLGGRPPRSSCETSRQAPREPDQALGVLGQELLVDPRPVIEALEVRAVTSFRRFRYPVSFRATIVRWRYFSSFSPGARSNREPGAT